MKYKILLFLFALLVLSNAQAAGTHTPSSHATLDDRSFEAAYTTHAPISITSDSDFETQGWPGNGSKANPYLIEGLNITTSGHCIEITSTTAHYKIENCLLSATSPTNNPGLYLFSAPNGTIQDCKMENHRSNVWLSVSDNCTFKNNTISETSNQGIKLWGSKQCAIINNTFANNSESAINLEQTSNSTIANNTFQNNGLVVSNDDQIEYWITHDVSGNTVNGKELAYLKNLNNTEIDASTHGQTILVNCNNITLANGTYNNASRGIQFAFCTNATIRNNTVLASKYGILQHSSPRSYVINNTARLNEIGFLLSSENMTASNNTATENQRGFYISGYNALISGNDAINNSQDGFRINTEESNFTQNIVSQNQVGLNLHYDDASNFAMNEVSNNSESGFYLNMGLGSTFLNNSISNSKHGMYITREAYQCSLYNNSFQQCGIFLDVSSLREWITSEDGNTVNGKTLGYFNGINGTQIDGSQYGQLVIVNSSFVEVESGLYENATEGVSLLFSDNCTIRGTSSVDNSVNAYRLFQAEDCILESNMAVNSVNHGFSIRSSKHIHLENNTAIENVHHGFYISYSDFIVSHNNTANLNSENGLHLAGTQWNTMTDVALNQNTAGNNTNYGFFVEYAMNFNLTNNLADDNGESGFWIDNSANLNLTGNQATQNGIHGISIAETDNGHLHTNTGTSNSFNGFSLDSCVGWILTNNSAVANQMGFSFDSVVNQSLEENSAISNLYYGYNFAKSSNLNLTGNNATYNDLIGFNFDDSDDCIALNNTVIQNGVGIELDDASENNLFYINNIGYNHHYNGFDDSQSTDWDNGTIGNCWSDYAGSGSYLVDGLANNIDNHPCLLDLYPPTLNQPQDFSYELGAGGNSITWEASDLRLDSYVVYRNGSVIDSGAADGVNLTVDVDGLDIGVYNYTIVVNDTLGKTSIDTAIVTVLDSTPPELDHPDDIDCELGSTGNAITWNPTDLEPDSYKLYQEGSLVEEGPWPGTVIEYSVDGLGVGTYVFTLVAYDTTGNNASDSVTVSVTDTTSPVVNSPDNLEYELGSNGNMISWDVSDLAPQIYRIIRNGTVVEHAPWEGEQISYNIDGLSLSTYNFTITVTDASGNNASNSVFVSVVDSTVPSLDSPADVEYELGSTGNVLTWNATDLDPQSYHIYRNGSSIHYASWEGSDIQCNLDGLSLGDHNFTVVITDGTGNNASDSVMVSVVDTTAPSLDSSSNIQYELGSTGNSIVWTAFELDPFYYVIYVDGSLVQNSSWNGAQIEYNVDGFTVGSHNIMVKVYDSSGNYANDTAAVYVADTVTPTIDSPPDFEYEVGSMGNSISWSVSDLDARVYEIHRNGLLIRSESWDGSDIQYNVDGLSVGLYNITLTICDGTGNQASDTVTIDVVDTVIPIISPPEDITYEVGTINQSISWNVSDAGTVTYILLRNETVLYGGSWNGSEIVVNIDALAPGTYNFTMVVTDEGGNQARDSVLVSVLPITDTTTSTTTTETTSTTTTGTTPPPGPNPMMIALAAGVAIAGIALIVVLFVIPRLKLEGRL